MNRKLAVVVAAVALSLPVVAGAQGNEAPAQPAPRIELFVGPQNRMDLGDPIARLSTTAHGSLRLGVDWNLTDKLAIVFADPRLGIASGESFGTTVDYSFLVGPRLRWRQGKRLMPFGYAVFGLARGALNRYHGPAPTAADWKRRTEFQAAAGVGADIRLNARLALRAQVEQRSLFGGPDGDYSLAVISGVVIRFGERR